jgi:hypothetical protein
MAARHDDESRITTLLSKCPWSADANDPQLLFGGDFRYVPFGWRLERDGAYTDTISDRGSVNRPQVPPIEENFAFKAIGARVCLQELNAFAQRWQEALPTEIKHALESVKAAANALEACAVGIDANGRSDFDEGLAASRIISKQRESANEQQRPLRQELESLSNSSWVLLRLIKGFCMLLQRTFNPKAALTLDDFRNAWNSADMDGYARAIASFWTEKQIIDRAEGLRNVLKDQRLSETATRIAQEYTSTVEEAKRKLDIKAAESPWTAEIVAVKWNLPLPRISRLSSL